MAKATYLKKLFLSFRDGDNEQFKHIAQQIIEDERSKNHLQLADELQRIMNSIVTRRKSDSNFEKSYLHLLPKDKDSNFSLLDVKESKLLLSDLVLTDDIQQLINGIIREYERSEILAAYGLTPRNKFLFCGPPGCGKTKTAEALAGELNIPILYTRFDSIVSSYLGETASNLRKVFDFASKGTWVIFFDEFDAVAKSRDNSDEHGELKRVVNSFLQLLDNFDGNSIIIAATNHQNLLDSAIWRRFDEVIQFDKPQRDDIEKLLVSLLKRYPCTELDTPALVKEMVGMTHSDIERICMTTIKKAIITGIPKINQDCLLKEITHYQNRSHIYSKETQGMN